MEGWAPQVNRKARRRWWYCKGFVLIDKEVTASWFVIEEAYSLRKLATSK
jgi:hypothetical protein